MQKWKDPKEVDLKTVQYIRNSNEGTQKDTIKTE